MPAYLLGKQERLIKRCRYIAIMRSMPIMVVTEAGDAIEYH